jgi:ADP-ribose pyrophosphatase YjhB (NUDIX family)
MADEPNGFVQWRHAPPDQWRYCPLCCADLVDQAWDGKVRRYCLKCGFVYWERPLPAAAAVVVDVDRPGEIVLVRRRYPPEEGQWTLPGGGIESGESVVQAALREVWEETGLVVEVQRQLGTWSTPTGETVITFFVGRRVSGTLRPGTDAQDAAWFAHGDIPTLAFSTHRDAVQEYLNGRIGPMMR